MNAGIRKKSSQARGHILLATLVVCAVLGLALAAFLNVITSQNSYTVRTQVWNACMPVVEAGLEEALAHINDITDTNWNDNGWTWDSTSQTFNKQRWLGSSYFSVKIATNASFPVITSTGFIPTPVTVGYGSVVASVAPGTVTNYISRTVRIVTRRDPLFNRALLARDFVDFSGFNCGTDSYNSNLGPYSTQIPGDKGDVGTDYSGPNAINSSNAKIKGHLFTGPGATIKVGPGSSIGSAGWVDSGQPGVQDGWWRSDLNVDIPDVTPPWKTPAIPPTAKGVYKYWLDSGNYELPDLIMNSGDQMYVSSNATLWVRGNVKMNGVVTIAQPGSLKLYMDGKATFAGTWNKSIYPADLQILGLPTCTSVAMVSLGGSLQAVINTPNADVQIVGLANMFGAAVVRSVKFTGNSFFHYDEALNGVPVFRPYTVATWEEL